MIYNKKKPGNSLLKKKLSDNERKKIARQHKVVTEAINVRQATEVRANFQEVIDHVHYTKEALIISKHNKPWVMISPLSEDK